MTQEEKARVYDKVVEWLKSIKKKMEYFGSLPNTERHNP